jgi:hypothetical protein
MKLANLGLMSCFLFTPLTVQAAWNTSGSLKTKIQADNRYTRYTDDARVLGELWGNVEIVDNQSWEMALDFVSRESSNGGFEEEIFQMYLQKELTGLNSKIKAGRFERSDSLGFYSLDGAAIQYKILPQGLTLNTYGGRPIRQEDMQSVTGEWVYGVELNSLQTLHWQLPLLPINRWSTRIGFQQFHDQQTSTRFSFGNLLAGQYNSQYIQAYELSLSTTLETESGTFEELFSSLLLDFTKNTRLRLNYSIYQPQPFYPTFKEKFYTTYYDGKQDLLVLSFNQRLNPNFAYHLSAKRAVRADEQEVGYGFDMGLNSDYFRDWRLSADFDMLEFGDSSSYSLYFAAQYSLSTNALLNLNLAYSLDDSPLYTQNKAAGTEVKFRYKIRRNLFMDLATSYILNSRLKDEYLAGAQMTWYFDNFVAKGAK